MLTTLQYGKWLDDTTCGGDPGPYRLYEGLGLRSTLLKMLVEPGGMAYGEDDIIGSWAGRAS